MVRGGVCDGSGLEITVLVFDSTSNVLANHKPSLLFDCFQNKMWAITGRIQDPLVFPCVTFVHALVGHKNVQCMKHEYEHDA